MPPTQSNQLPFLPESVGDIGSERLRLEPLGRRHADALFPILADDALYEFTGDEPPESPLTLRQRYESLESRLSPDGEELWLNWIVVDVNEGCPIGYVQATVNQRVADIGWVVGTRWQGRGYASEAARAMVGWLVGRGVVDIRASINPKHRASQRVAANVGLMRTRTVVNGETVWVRCFKR